LLDEPSEGLAPVVVASLLAQVERLKREGLTILLAEQGLEFSLALADRAYVLEKGAVRHAGTAAQLREDAALRNLSVALCPAAPAKPPAKPKFSGRSGFLRQTVDRIGVWTEFCHASPTGFTHRTRVCDPLHRAHDLQCDHDSGAPQSDEFNRAPSPTDCAAGRAASGHAKL